MPEQLKIGNIPEGEKIYPNPKTPKELEEEGQFDSFPIKDRAGTEVNMFDNKLIHDPNLTFPFYHPQAGINPDPLTRRKDLLTKAQKHKGKLILSEENRNTTKYHNGVTYRDPITLYHGTTWNKKDHFELTKREKKEYGYWGSGNYFVSEIGDAVPYPTSRNDEMKEVIPTDLQK